MEEKLQKPQDDQKPQEAAPLQDERNAKERLYDKIPVTVKTLDVIIKVLIALLALALALGIYFGNFA